MSRVVFDYQGGSIGRSQDNTCVLPDPDCFVSRRHAVIVFENDACLLTDTSDNGVFINDSDEPVGNNKTVRLRDGDCLVMGDYVLGVSLESSQQESPRTPVGIADTPGKAPVILVGDAQQQKIPDIHVGDKAKASGSPPRRPAAEPDHVPAVNQYMPPPQVQKEQVSGGPEWDRTDKISSAKKEAGHPTGGKGAVPAPASDQNASGGPAWDQTEIDLPAVQPESDRDAPDDMTSSQAGYDPLPGPDIANEQVEEPRHIQPELPDATGKVMPGNPGESAQAFFAAAGLDVTQLSAAEVAGLMKLFGGLYRDIVQGLMDVLKARSNLKNEFRMQHTQISITKNNPLKFSGRVDEALEHLVFNRSSGFLPAEAAFREAFDDIKDHQIAMVAGMRAAFESLLRRFDPEQLENRVIKGKALGNLLPINRRAKCWDRYEEWYGEISAAAEDDFQELFGNEFTRAYEEQMARLSLLHKKRDE